MNSIKAITQLEELKRDRLSFIQNDESDLKERRGNNGK